ncbi:MAG: hypothetical protein HOE30_00590 [Deltaproteobacteria bacterium]|jgi:hypothetical protein|nr:hypothetical protein [Deltaproteobacteria bacterium]MBT4086966.1 hypothetical protein [Deltaproteobacteria bacterium]MBT4266628.1 hypothetical protein [Deltaproteobacteria bacterium]MBT4642562.1 hypothetical protein [Deltaproteobacteria bacterium]MBT6501720.1 hypothetical protein [Deltaproteobacteria bacterium]
MTQYEDDIELDDIENLNTALEFADEYYVLPLHYSKYNPLTNKDECSCGDQECGQVGRHPQYEGHARSQKN